MPFVRRQILKWLFIHWNNKRATVYLFFIYFNAEYCMTSWHREWILCSTLITFDWYSRIESIPITEHEDGTIPKIKGKPPDNAFDWGKICLVTLDFNFWHFQSYSYSETFKLKNFQNEKWADKHSLKQLFWIKLSWIYRFSCSSNEQ